MFLYKKTYIHTNTHRHTLTILTFFRPLLLIQKYIDLIGGKKQYYDVNGSLILTVEWIK